MANLDVLHKIVLSLPETTEGTSFRLKAYKVCDKPFIIIKNDNVQVELRMDKPNIRKYISQSPKVFSEVWQVQKLLIGLRLNISTISEKQLKELVELSWRFKAPKKVSARVKRTRTVSD